MVLNLETLSPLCLCSFLQRCLRWTTSGFFNPD